MMKFMLVISLLFLGILVNAQPHGGCTPGTSKLGSDNILYGCVEGTWREFGEVFEGPSSEPSTGQLGLTHVIGLNAMVFDNGGKVGDVIYGREMKNIGFSPIDIPNEIHQEGKVIYGGSPKHFYVGVPGRLWHQIDNESQHINIPEFDHLVIRYFWEDGAGTDLDTATGFSNLAGSSINKKSVGWKGTGFDRNLPAQVARTTVGDPVILEWIGDNRKNGYESVLVSYQNIPANNNGYNYSTYDITLAGNWYSFVGTGVVQMELIAYKGGTMTKNTTSFLWENSGGTEVFKQVYSKKITSTGKLPDGARNLWDDKFSDVTGPQAIGEVIINPIIKQAFLRVYN